MLYTRTMDRAWLKQYPPGVPADIDPDRYASLRDIFEESCAAHGHSPAFTNMGATLSYAQLDELSRAFAAWLQKKSGLDKGDRIALMMPNILQYPIALFGALRAGMVVVNTNPLYTARELEHQLKDSGAKAIVIVENFAHVLQQVLPRTDLKRVLVTGVGDLLGIPRGFIVNFVLKYVRKQIPEWKMPGTMTFKSALGSGLGLKLDPVPLGGEDMAFLQYTGGTTGVAKAAVLTHRNMVANVLQSAAWITPALKTDGARVIITALPLYHIFALTTNCLVFLPLGARNVLITNPRDFKAFVAELKKYKFSFISGVNTLFNALLHTPDFETVDFSALQVTFAGGMALQGVDAARFVYIEDRKKDMILVSGFNVYPNEVESVGAEHPGVLEVAAVAQPDENSGEVVALFVVKKDPSLTAEALIAYCRTELTGYKVPRHVYFRSELPKTNVGKILRRALRDELRAAAHATTATA